jgi:hypothetical protein
MHGMYSGCRFKFWEGPPWVSLLLKRTKLDRLLVQFAYDVNYFFPGNIEMLVLNGLTLEKNAQQLVQFICVDLDTFADQVFAVRHQRAKAYARLMRKQQVSPEKQSS